MSLYKCIATLTWKFDSGTENGLELARKQLAKIVNTEPDGDDYEGFNIQIDLATLKDRHRVKHIQEYDPDYVFSFINEVETRTDFVVDNKVYSVKMNSDRLKVFRQNMHCVACGLKGTKMYLDINSNGCSPHFNLYGEEHGRLILMTKDHIIPKSKGGKDTLENYVTMCSYCNNLKGNSSLQPEEIKKLRELLNNPDNLPRKELKDLINNTRDDIDKSHFPVLEMPEVDMSIVDSIPDTIVTDILF